jgi:Sec-independent protein translocase protein TatA
MAGLSALTRTSGPLVPDPDTAHDWLRQELLKPDYQPSLVERLRDWFGQLFDKSQSGTGNFAGLGRPLLLLLLLLLVAGIVLLVVRLRRNPGAGRDAGSVFGDVRRTAAEHRKLARAAFDAGEWDDSVVEAMRALAARLVERQLVDDVPAATAHEVTTLATPRFPSYDQRLEDAARVFDETRYGDRRATRERARTMIDLERELDTAGPTSDDGRRGPVAAVPR